MTRDREAIADTVPGLGTTVDDGPPAPSSMPERGHSIGRFVVLDVLGTGGMGVVYAAYDPSLDRKVAIKVLRARAMESEEARLRLLREAQAMARIDHPNVLRVHEADAVGDHIYIAMEFASGGNLRDWLAASRRTTREIIALFVQAGRGLAAAHAAGLVHRDFKPDNVLLVGDGVARVTDFGVVGVVGEAAPMTTVVDAPITETTPLSQDLTRTGAMMGTPAYMSSEQFRGGVVGPAADQFAFCVALYEALYRVRPYPGVTVAELCANVISGEVQPPPKDSDVPARIRRVVLRGLSRAPAQRYPTMERLLAELGGKARQRTRVIIGAAVGAVAAGAIAFAVLGRANAAECTGAEARLATAWNPAQRTKLTQAFEASGRPGARAVVDRVVPTIDRWSQSWQQGYIGACEDTRMREVQSEHVLDLRMACLGRQLEDARATIDALASGGVDAVDHAVVAARALPAPLSCSDIAVLTATVAPPATEEARKAVAAIRDKLSAARAERSLGHYATGLATAKSALETARGAGYPPATAEALIEVGTLQDRLADHDAPATLAEAMHLALSAGDDEAAVRAAASRLDTLAENPKRFALADEVGEVAGALAAHARPSVGAMIRLDNATANLYEQEGHLDKAETRYRESLVLATSKLGPDAPLTITTLDALAVLAANQHKYEDALKMFQQVLEADQRVDGPDHPDVATALENVANAYESLEQPVDSKKDRERALAIRIAAFGPDHPDVAHTYDNIGGMYARGGDHATAKTYYEKAIAILRKAQGDDSIELVGPEHNLSMSLDEMGDMASSRAAAAKALALTEKAYGADDPRTAEELFQLGNVERDAHQLADALPKFQRFEAIMEKAYGPNDGRTLDAEGSVAATYMDMDQLPQARELMGHVVDAMTNHYGPDHPRVGLAIANYGLLQIKLKDPKGALASLRRAQAIFEAALGKNHPFVANVLVGVGHALCDLHREAEALPELDRASAIAKASQLGPNVFGDLHMFTAMALDARPADRERAIAEAKLALGAYRDAHSDKDVADAERWLHAHGVRN